MSTTQASRTRTKQRTITNRRPAAPKQSAGHPASATQHTAASLSDLVLNKISNLTQIWSPTLARILLSAVLGWFGYHELVAPSLWTGYIPILSPTSHLADILVLAHGWLLMVLAVMLLAGIVPRAVAGITCLLLLEIVISLTASGGVSDLVLRDVGVLGLSVSLIGQRSHRLVLQG